MSVAIYDRYIDNSYNVVSICGLVKPWSSERPYAWASNGHWYNQITGAIVIKNLDGLCDAGPDHPESITCHRELDADFAVELGVAVLEHEKITPQNLLFVKAAWLAERCRLCVDAAERRRLADWADRQPHSDLFFDIIRNYCDCGE